MSGWDTIFTLAACPVCEHWPRERLGERCPECGDHEHPGFVIVNERGIAPPRMSRAYYERKRAEAREQQEPQA